jgi:tripartite ATP-independent transporter DctP family solute receptor
MKTKLFPGAASVLAVILFVLGAPAQAAQKTYRIGYLLSLDSQLGAGAKAFVEVVSKRTGGRIHIEQEPDSNLGGEVDMLKGIQQGTVDIAFITGAPLPNFVPEVGVFSIPFLFRDANHAYAVLDGPIGRQYLDKFGEKGMVALAWGENGLRHITNSKRPVRAPDDLKGLKLRLPQSEVMLAGFKAFGAEVASLPFPQLYGALQSGQFDGQENPIATIRSAKFSQVQKYLSVSGHVYDPAIIVVSKDLWSELGAADKAVFEEAARAAAKASRIYSAEAQKSGVEELRKQGMDVVEQVERDKFVAALQPVMGEYGKKFGADVIAAIQNTK